LELTALAWLVGGVFLTPSSYSVDIKAEGANFKCADYKSDGRLHFILYGREAKVDAGAVKLKNVLVDVAGNDLKDINDVKDFSNLVLYEQGTSLEKILEFWEDKPFTDCFIATPEAVYDQAAKMVRGEQKVWMRSKAMDVDGVGFDADYTERIVHIRGRVRVIIRAGLLESDKSDKSDKNNLQKTTETREKP
jgi:hypothetical protein